MTAPKLLLSILIADPFFSGAPGNPPLRKEYCQTGSFEDSGFFSSIAEQTIAPLAPRTTLSCIAKELNLTAATVSRALNDHPKISAHTKESVLQAAKRMHYKKNRIASSLRSGKSHMIGVIIPSTQMNFFGSVVHGIESIANTRGINVLIVQSNEHYLQEVQGMEALQAARVDGILVSIAKETVDFSHFRDAEKRGIPLVFFDRSHDNLGIPSVVVDDYKGAFLATENLIRQGYRRIAHIAGPQHVKVCHDRLMGYMAALQANHLPFEPSLVFAGDITLEAGRQAAGYFMSLPHPPDAAFAVEDFSALGLLKGIKEMGLAIPGEFGIVGFANEGFGEHTSPSLSSIDQQTVLMGKEAASLLLQLIDEQGNGHKASARIVLDPLPVYRESSGRKYNS